MVMDLQLPRGTRDILPEEVSKWHFLETEFKKCLRKLPI